MLLPFVAVLPVAKVLLAEETKSMAGVSVFALYSTRYSSSQVAPTFSTTKLTAWLSPCIW